MKLAKLTSGAGMVLFAVLALASTLPAQTQALTVLHTFTGVPDGERPYGRLLLDPAGILYGTTTIGGTIGGGSVFKVDASGNESVFYSFAGPPDGSEPLSGVIRDADGNLYGATDLGGTRTQCTSNLPGPGCGIVFKLDPSGVETVLHHFGSNGLDGVYPAGPLAIDGSGNLWGTTEWGGNGGCSIPDPPHRPIDVGCGTVFKVDASGNETLVHNFVGNTGDGTWPLGGVVQDQAGNLYGATKTGGLMNCASDWFGECGTVFKVDTSGQFSTLYSFKGGDGGPDGDIPESSLILDPAGNLYGTTNAGGTVVCAALFLPGITCGTMFQLTPAGKETVLHSFGGVGDAGFPISGLVRDAAGNFYGMVSGLVIKFDSMGKESVLYTFTGYDIQASGDLVQDAAGNLYGTTYYGANGKGTVFKLTTPPDFAVAFTLSPASVPAGGSASAPLDIITVSGFNDTVTFACSVSPKSAQAPQCSVNATPGTPASVTVTTSGPSARVTSSSGAPLSYALWLPLLGLVGIGRFGSKQGKIKVILLGFVLCLGVASQVACGGGTSGGNRGTPAGAYTITVTGTSGAATGSLVRSTSATLHVQ